MSEFHRFPRWAAETGAGPGAYVASAEICDAVNAAIAAGQPLLVTGEPGVGKTDLAAAIHWHLDEPGGVRWAYDWYTVRSDSRGRDLLYEFDHLQRLFDAQRGGGLKDPMDYVRLRPLGRALSAGRPTVLLIDEIDKAPRDFPNDLLHELDKRSFRVEEAPELGTFQLARETPLVVVITSNQERDLPDAFLRRCVFVRLPFPSEEQLEEILWRRLGLAPKAKKETDPSAPTRPPRPADAATQQERADAATQHNPGLEALATASHALFWQVRRARQERDWRKIPSIGELLRWVEVLRQSGRGAEAVQAASLRALFPGVLVKTGDDLSQVLGRLSPQGAADSR